MTMPGLEAVGFCAHYSVQGDWAFELALAMARRNLLQLNIFHFLSDPYNPTDRTGAGRNRDAVQRIAVAKEKHLRLYYDPKLGDYLDVGFRLCEDREWTELHRCLTRREFQVLVLACPRHDSTFGGKPLDEFMDSFVCPVVAVGPGSPLDIRLNSPARLIADRLGLEGPMGMTGLSQGGLARQAG
jgi:hypothetical protein